MKAITLWQPWASMVAMGLKQNETRSWAPPKALIGERIAIHAAKRVPKIEEHIRLVKSVQNHGAAGDLALWSIKEDPLDARGRFRWPRGVTGLPRPRTYAAASMEIRPPAGLQSLYRSGPASELP